MPAPVAFVLKGYPRLSETFIAQEILGLERLGLDIRLFSMRRPTDTHVHPIHRQIAAPVVYLPEYLHEEPVRVLRAWRKVRRLPGYAASRRLFVRDLRRQCNRNRLRRFGQALVLAAELPPEVATLHAHFLHTPASVARYTATMRGLPWSVSAHAKDVWTIPGWEKREKLADCAWAATCTRYNADHLRTLATDPSKVELLYHGIDLVRFPPAAGVRESRDGKDQERPVRLLSVGRAVEKKGFDVLLHALARLPDGLAWRLQHIGGGPLLPRLKRQAKKLGLLARIDWLGPQPADQVLAAYRRADVFVLACRVSRDGDRDGLPNVLMEAQSQRVACAATDVSAIPELIRTGVNGLLVPPENPAALARAIERLICQPDFRERLAVAGERRVRADFTASGGLARLAEKFGVSAPAEPPCASLSTHR